MAPTLKNDLEVWRLARDLGLSPKPDPLTAILRSSLTRIKLFLSEFPCETLSELLTVAAAKLDTEFVEIHSDAELELVKNEFFQKGEKAFALLEKELAPDVYAVTFRRLAATAGDRQFVSVIDCRGEKSWRSYFSKWHELAHLLTLTQQGRLSFRRTHQSLNQGNAEEAVMDAIAGEVGFFPEIVKHHAQGEISFARIGELRDLLCPEASLQASVIGFVRGWQSACVLIEAGLGWKRGQESKLAQGTFGFTEKPVAELRALRVTMNHSARERHILLPKNMRVPKASVINQVFVDGIGESTAVEDLCWWEASGGRRLEPLPVRVVARKSRDRVLALLVPID